MSLNNATAERPQAGTAGPPKTAAECLERIARLNREQEDLTIKRMLVDERLKACDADFAADDMQVERLETQRAELQAKIDRVRRRVGVLHDELLPQLQRSDRLAEADRHKAAAQALELQARPLRRSLRNGLLQVLEAVQRLDALKARHAEHAGAYSGILENLAKEERPNYFTPVSLPLGAAMRNHGEAVKMLWEALSGDGRDRDPERFADKLDRALMPYDTPPVEEEED